MKNNDIFSNIKLYYSRKKANEKGITLIALIVTIIVLLILIGVTVHLTVNGKGIFYHAKRAAFVHDMKSYQEQAEMYIAGESLEAKDKNVEMENINVGLVENGQKSIEDANIFKIENKYKAQKNEDGTIKVPEQVIIQTIISKEDNTSKTTKMYYHSDDSIKDNELHVKWCKETGIPIWPDESGTPTDPNVPQTDTSEIVVTLNTNGKTSNTITVVASAKSEKGMPENPVYTYYLDGIPQTSIPSTTYTYQDLQANTEYKLKVTTADKEGNEGEKAIKETTCKEGEEEKPTNPSGENGSGNSGSVTSSTDTVEAEIDEIQVGDTVYYNPPSNKSYTAEKTYTGASADQTLTSDNSSVTVWKVWKIDKVNHIIEIVSSDATGTALTLAGENGFNNGVKILNDACDTLYTDETRGITAKSMDTLNIEEAMHLQNSLIIRSDEWQNYIKTNFNANYGTNYTPSNNKVPNHYTKANIISEQLYDQRPSNDKYATGYTKRSGFTYTENYYNIPQANFATHIGAVREGILGTRTSWLASKCLNNDTDYANFNTRNLSSGSLDKDAEYNSKGDTNSASHGMTPLAYLSQLTKIIKVTGQDRTWRIPDGTQESSAGERLYLYNYGDECTNVTGGWIGSLTLSTQYNGIYQKNKDSLLLSYSTMGYSASCFTTSKNIDISPYTKLYVKYKKTKNTFDQNQDDYSRKNSRLYVDVANYRRFNEENPYTGDYFVKYDVSNINAQSQIVLIASDNTDYIYQVYLEK